MKCPADTSCGAFLVRNGEDIEMTLGRRGNHEFGDMGKIQRDRYPDHPVDCVCKIEGNRPVSEAIEEAKAFLEQYGIVEFIPDAKFAKYGMGQIIPDGNKEKG